MVNPYFAFGTLSDKLMLPDKMNQENHFNNSPSIISTQPENFVPPSSIKSDEMSSRLIPVNNNSGTDVANPSDGNNIKALHQVLLTCIHRCAIGERIIPAMEDLQRKTTNVPWL